MKHERERERLLSHLLGCGSEIGGWSWTLFSVKAALTRKPAESESSNHLDQIWARSADSRARDDSSTDSTAVWKRPKGKSKKDQKIPYLRQNTGYGPGFRTFPSLPRGDIPTEKEGSCPGKCIGWRHAIIDLVLRVRTPRSGAEGPVRTAPPRLVQRVGTVIASRH